MTRAQEMKARRFTDKQWTLLRNAEEKHPLEVEVDKITMRSVRILNRCGFLTVAGNELFLGILTALGSLLRHDTLHTNGSALRRYRTVLRAGNGFEV